MAEELTSEVERLAAPGEVADLAGLVLDVRDNPGGLLSQAVAVTDLFLDEGVIVSTRARHAEEAVEEHFATPGGFPATLPTVVLVNGMSASASEIVASALQDTGRGVLVGVHTYGKGTVQKVYLVPGSEPEAQSALKLTVGRYYTPSGQPVAPQEGRAPDHVVPIPAPPSALERLRERLAHADLEEAERQELLALVAEIPSADSGTASIDWDRPVAERLHADPQLQKALSLLRPPAHPPGRTPPPE